MPGPANMKHLNEHSDKPNLLSLEKKDPRLCPAHRSTRNLHTTPSQQKRGYDRFDTLLTYRACRHTLY